MAREKKPVHKVQMTDGKRNIIRQLLEEYDIQSEEDSLTFCPLVYLAYIFQTALVRENQNLVGRVSGSATPFYRIKC